MKVGFTRCLEAVPAYLLVDDSPSIRLALAAALRLAHEGTTVRIAEAASEKEAIDLFLAETFDIVFLDLMLSAHTSALDALRAILAAKPDARVVLTTGLEREHPDVIEGISIGAFGYLRKPVRAAEVRAVIEEVATETGHVGRIR